MAPPLSRQLGDIIRKAPSATATGAVKSAALAEEVAPPSDSPDLSRVDETTQPVATPKDPEVPLQVTVPKRIRKQLMMMAAEQDGSVRALVLRAVRTLGIEVADDELRDKRRKP